MSKTEDPSQPDRLPYKTEYAKSGRASCKECKNAIGKNELRIAAMVKFYNEIIPNWFHLNCFFVKNKPKVKNLQSTNLVVSVLYTTN